ncbi:MAG: hypothetical protein FWF82_02155, partial [Oscillospiraceae bacterium]|nr:hypothetical protein [Oscillospiraceae bacterium]
MKNKKAITGLVSVCLAVLISAMFTGCEPNVPENDNNNTTTTSKTNATTTEVTDEFTGDNTDEFTDDFTDDFTDEFTDEFTDDFTNDNTDEFNENGTNDNDTAVGGDSTADFATESLGSLVITESLRPLALTSRKLDLLASNPNKLGFLTSTAQENDFTHLPNNKIGWGLGNDTDEYKRPLDA